MRTRRFLTARRLLVESTLAGIELPATALRAQLFHLEKLRTEYAVNPIGIDEPAPRLSWMLHSERRGTMQSAYEIRVAESAAGLTATPLWSSGKVMSGESSNRAYAGPAVKPGGAITGRCARGMTGGAPASGARRRSGRRD